MRNFTNDDLAKILTMSIVTELHNSFGVKGSIKTLLEQKKLMLDAIEDGDLIDALLNDFNNNEKKLVNGIDL